MQPRGEKIAPLSHHPRTPLHGLLVSRFLPRPSQVVRFAIQTITRFSGDFSEQLHGIVGVSRWEMGEAVEFATWFGDATSRLLTDFLCRLGVSFTDALLFVSNRGLVRAALPFVIPSEAEGSAVYLPLTKLFLSILIHKERGIGKRGIKSKGKADPALPG